MNIQVNGQPRDVAEGSTLRDLLDHLGLPEEGIAVAVDGVVIPRGRHRETPLRDGATIEVIRAVGGG